MIPVVRQNRVSLSVRLAGQLWSYYGEAGFSAGDRLPGVREIGEQFGVSVNVALAAMGHLARRKLVDPRRRRGCVLLRDPGSGKLPAVGNRQVVMDFPVSGSAYMRRYSQLIAREGQRHGLHFYIYDGEACGVENAKVRTLRDVLDGRFEAAVLFHAEDSGPYIPYLKRIRRKQSPVVFIEGDPDPIADWWDRIGSDENAGGHLTAERLLAAGHRRIGHIGPTHSLTGRDEPRLKGLMEGLRTGGVELSAAQCFEIKGRLLYQPGGMSDELRAWLTRVRPTAITLFSDVYFPGLWPVLRELGWEVGRDVSVIGYDAAPVEDSGVDCLSTVDPHQEAVAKNVVEVLLKRLAGDRSGPFRHWAQPTFVQGATLCPPRK